jgi:sulfide dehydrogenase cytochrome subunit
MEIETMNMRIMGLLVALAVGLLVLSNAASSDGTAPAKACLECHGADGISTDGNVPTIAGISSFVHADYLYAFQDGARECGSDYGDKCSVKNDLTEDQIEGLAEYFAGMKFKAAKQAFDADKAALGAGIHAENCDKCHSDGGANPDDDASILAGQWMAYLQSSMAQFVADEREQPTTMKRKMEVLSEADVEALAHYYASQQ